MDVALIAVQLELGPDAVAGADAFARWIEDAAAAAVARAPNAGHRLIVFPEATGHVAPLALAPAAARRQPTIDRALAVAAVRHPLAVVRAAIDTGGVRHGALGALLPDADRLVARVFAQVARRHRAHVVAGSHLALRDGHAIVNRSYTFDPTGRRIATTDKVNLVPWLEDARPGGLGLGRGAPQAVPVVEAPWGRLATLICYDGFREPHTHGERWVAVGPRVDDAGVDVIANPAANPWPWQGPWVHADPGEDILRCDQWRTEGLPATLAGLRHARWGVTAHLVGRVLDQHFEGQSEILRRDGDTVTVVARCPDPHRGDACAALASLGADATSVGKEAR